MYTKKERKRYDCIKKFINKYLSIHSFYITHLEFKICIYSLTPLHTRFRLGRPSFTDSAMTKRLKNFGAFHSALRHNAAL